MNPAAEPLFAPGLVADYGDIEGEAVACRSACALFDFSFVARARLSGPGALDALAGLTTRPLDDLAEGRIRYALHAGADDTLLSDLTVWALGGQAFEVMTGRAADLIALANRSRLEGFEDLSGETAIFAVQGPMALRALAGLTELERLAGLPYFGHCEAVVADVPCRVGRLGYTGERGFELVLPRSAAKALWERLAQRARPAGFAAADRLRIEAGLPLFVNDFALPVTAAEAGLARFAGPDERPGDLRWVCARGMATQRPILWRPRAGVDPPSPGHMTVTSACWSPLADGVLALGYVRSPDAVPSRRVEDASGAFRDLTVAPLPFYDTDKRRPRGGWARGSWLPA